MKNFRWIFIFSVFLLNINTSHAAGPYEMGSIEIDGYTCRWTTTVRKSCYAADMKKIQKDFISCDEKYVQQKHCRDIECINREVKQAASYCCTKTGGNISY